LLVATNAAREGARYAAAHTTDTTLTTETQSFVWSYLQSGYGNRLNTGGDITVTSDQVQIQFFDTSGNANATDSPGYRVKVTVPVQATVFTGFVPGLTNPMTVTGVASMQLQ